MDFPIYDFDGNRLYDEIGNPVITITGGSEMLKDLSTLIDIQPDWGVDLINGIDDSFDIPFTKFDDFEVNVDSINFSSIINGISGLNQEQKDKLERIINEQKKLADEDLQAANRNLMDMNHEEFSLYQSYISELQKAKSKKIIELINKAIDIINNTPEGKTLSDVSKYPYKKEHEIDFGRFSFVIYMVIDNVKELNELLNKKHTESVNINELSLDNLADYKLRESLSNLFLYYQGLKNKLNKALDRELERIEYLEKLFTKDNGMNGWDMLSHFRGDSGRTLNLHDIGVHNQVRELMHKQGGFEKPEGSIQSRFISQIQRGERIDFKNQYDFAKEARITIIDPLWAIGGATVSGVLTDVKAENTGDKYNVSGVISYKLDDKFSSPWDIYNWSPVELNFGGTPYDITGEWSEIVNFDVDKDVYENKIKPMIGQ
ncbi:hypothetical protein [Xenorhabdus bovienii]|uniref:Uncharacterized protein n=1 Tax=Xenorhabdus bovienii str. feltiae Moldova TaxID=1398200 RepID=A0A077P027_XENBV|nr:hypothetical protein [Xenorhabdus bovienii]CDH04039.1 hypothetical protein XBFM1_950003 [Xenorhabdus bovienii str. feltiae Moldova]